MSKSTVRVNVIAPFTFINQDHTQEKYEPGIYDMDKEKAEHWFVKAHSGSIEVQQPVVSDADKANAASGADVG